MDPKEEMPPRPVISCSCCTLCLSHTMGHCLLPLYSLVIAPIYINIINFIFTLLASKDEWTYKWMHFSISRKSENLWQALFGFRLSLYWHWRRGKREAFKVGSDEKLANSYWINANTNTSISCSNPTIQIPRHIEYNSNNTTLAIVSCMDKCAKRPKISDINLAHIIP